jgi:hypothetical protein
MLQVAGVRVRNLDYIGTLGRQLAWWRSEMVSGRGIGIINIIGWTLGSYDQV